MTERTEDLKEQKKALNPGDWVMGYATDKSKELTEAALEKQGEETLAEVCDVKLEIRWICKITDKKFWN